MKYNLLLLKLSFCFVFAHADNPCEQMGEDELYVEKNEILVELATTFSKPMDVYSTYASDETNIYYQLEGSLQAFKLSSSDKCTYSTTIYLDKTTTISDDEVIFTAKNLQSEILDSNTTIIVYQGNQYDRNI